MRNEDTGGIGTLAPLDFRKACPLATKASRVSEGLGWVGLEAARSDGTIDFESANPPMTHHRLVLFVRPPEELDLLYEGVKRHVPPPAGSIYVVPAGIPVQVRAKRWKDSVHVYLEPGLISRVGAEAFGLDPAQLTVPPLDALVLPQLRAAMLAVNAELTSRGIGGPLAAESLANVLAVHLIRHVLAPRQPERGSDGALPRGRLRAVIDYVQGHLEADPSLAEMAAVAGLSPYHFARQFKAATGLPPHAYLIMCRVERAKELLQAGIELSLAQVAARAGFSDQSQFCHHFRRLIGLTPGRFRTPTRNA